MTYPATQLISEAFYISSVVGHDFQVMSGAELSYGLNLLNSVINRLRIQSDMIPYTRTGYNFVATAGQELYFIPNLTAISTLVFYTGSVRWAMVEVPRVSYFGSNRVQNIESLPVSYHTERVLGGMNVYLYFPPNQAYQMELTGLFAPAPVTTGTDLSAVFDGYFIDYLKYATAVKICIDYDVMIPPQVAKELSEYQMQIKKISSPPDLTMQFISSFGNSNSINYAQVAIGQGFTVASGY